MDERDCIPLIQRSLNVHKFDNKGDDPAMAYLIRCRQIQDTNIEFLQGSIGWSDDGTSDYKWKLFVENYTSNFIDFLYRLMECLATPKRVGELQLLTQLATNMDYISFLISKQYELVVIEVSTHFPLVIQNLKYYRLRLVGCRLQWIV